MLDLTDIDLTDIALEIKTEEGTNTVPFPFDFSDFSPYEVERTGILTEGAGDPVEVACAFVFVAAAREVDLSDEAWPSFRDRLAPLFAGDTSIFRWEDDRG